MSCNRPQTIKINIPFIAKTEVNGEYMGYIDHPHAEGCVYASTSKAKTLLKKRLTEQINDGLKSLRNQSARAIGCKDGTVLIVMYRSGAWGYHIAGDGRKYAGSSVGGDRLEDVVEQAKRHAEQSYGGVAWESSL